MGILSDLTSIFTALKIPCETGKMSSVAADTYVVLVPIAEESLWGDDTIDINVEECMISLYTKFNYKTIKKTIIDTLLSGGYTITDRRYVEYEEDTMYYHYEIYVEHPYPYEPPEEEDEEENSESENSESEE